MAVHSCTATIVAPAYVRRDGGTHLGPFFGRCKPCFILHPTKCRMRSSLLVKSCRGSSYRCSYPCLLLLQGHGEGVGQSPLFETSAARARAIFVPVNCMFLRCVLGTHIDQMKRNCLAWNEFMESSVLKRSFKQHKTYSRLCRYFPVTRILILSTW